MPKSPGSVLRFLRTFIAVAVVAVAGVLGFVGYRGPNEPDILLLVPPGTAKCVADPAAVDQAAQLRIGLRGTARSILRVEIAVGDIQRTVVLQPGEATVIALDNPKGDHISVHCTYDDLVPSDVDIAIRGAN
jgi:hypothetical protein